MENILGWEIIEVSVLSLKLIFQLNREQEGWGRLLSLDESNFSLHLSGQKELVMCSILEIIYFYFYFIFLQVIHGRGRGRV